MPLVDNPSIAVDEMKIANRVRTGRLFNRENEKMFLLLHADAQYQMETNPFDGGAFIFGHDMQNVILVTRGENQRSLKVGWKLHEHSFIVLTFHRLDHRLDPLKDSAAEIALIFEADRLEKSIEQAAKAFVVIEIDAAIEG